MYGMIKNFFKNIWSNSESSDELNEPNCKQNEVNQSMMKNSPDEEISKQNSEKVEKVSSDFILYLIKSFTEF